MDAVKYKYVPKGETEPDPPKALSITLTFRGDGEVFINAGHFIIAVLNPSGTFKIIDNGLQYAGLRLKKSGD